MPAVIPIYITAGAIDAKLGLFARLSQRERGVQLISLSTDAEAVVQMRMTCEASMRLDFEQFIPDLVIEPVGTVYGVGRQRPAHSRLL